MVAKNLINSINVLIRNCSLRSSTVLSTSHSIHKNFHNQFPAMAAENEHVGDHPDEVESVEDEETEKDSSKFLNFHDVFTALKSQHLADTMAALPPSVVRRVKALKQIQLQATNIEAKFFEEVHKLECKYHTQFVPLYEKRKTIVSGSYEPTDEESKWASDEEDEINGLSKDVKKNLSLSPKQSENSPQDGKKQDGDKADSVDDASIKGIPEFWLTVFKNVTLLADMVQDHDEPILKHLVDIKTHLIEEPMVRTK